MDPVYREKSLIQEIWIKKYVVSEMRDGKRIAKVGTVSSVNDILNSKRP